MICTTTTMSLAYSKWLCVHLKVNMCCIYCIMLFFPKSSISFFVTSWLVTMSSDVTDVWQCDHDVTLLLTLDPNKENKRKKKKRELNKETSVQTSHVWHMTGYFTLMVYEVTF